MHAQLAKRQVETLQYAKVMMSLKEIVGGPFFDQYVKSGKGFELLITLALGADSGW